MLLEQTHQRKAERKSGGAFLPYNICTAQEFVFNYYRITARREDN
jgi:hypothetical protein